MSIVLDTERILLPRWRLFHTAENFDELNHLSNTPPVEEEKIDHLNAIEEWRINNNLENSIELCASAIVQGCFEDATDAALFILDTRPSSNSVIAMAEKVLNPNKKIATVKLDDKHACIANLKKKINRSPSNSVFWIDIAFLYSTLGQNDKAERAIKNALILASNNRFVVRCAARFFMHINKKAEAHCAVKNYRFLKQDPWVLATELAISSKRKQTSKYLKLSKTAIEKNRISEFHSSELASALGLVELSYGSNRKAVKLFRHSLRAPADNSIAQAQWVENEHKLGISLDTDITDKDGAHEAQFYQFYGAGEWRNAMKSADKWADYEPYSTRSFGLMSYVALVCQDDFENCIKHCDQGVKRKTESFIFLNNATVAYAQMGKIQQAEEKFKLIKTRNIKEIEKQVYLATAGMLAFRNNDIDEGRNLYEHTIKQLNFGKHKNKNSENLARLFWAREEIIAKTDRSYNFFHKTKAKMKNEKSKDILAFTENIEKLLPDRNCNQK